MTHDRYLLARASLNVLTAAAALLPVAVAAGTGALGAIALAPVLVALLAAPVALAHAAERDVGRRPSTGPVGTIHRLAPLYVGFLIVVALSAPAAGGVALLSLLVGGEIVLLALAHLPRLHGIHLLNTSALVAGAQAVNDDAALLAPPFLVLLALSLAYLHFETKRRRAHEPAPRAPDDLVTPARVGLAAGALLAAVFAVLLLVAPAPPPRTTPGPPGGAAAGQPGPRRPFERRSPGRTLRLVGALAGIVLALYGYHRWRERGREAAPALAGDEGRDADVQVADLPPRPAPATRTPPPADARARVVAEYARFATALERRGLGRRPEQAPAEHAAGLAAHVPAAGPDLDELLARFHRARYGAGPVAADEPLLVRERAERVLARVAAVTAASPGGPVAEETP